MAGQQLVVDNVVVGGTTIKEMDFQPRLRPSDYSIMCSSNSILSLKPMKASIDYCPVWRCQCVCVCVCVCACTCICTLHFIRIRVIIMPLGGDACVLHCAGWAGFVLTWHVCVCLKESSCFIRLSGGVLVPYGLASKDLVQTQAYKLSSIFILTSSIQDH